MINENILRFSDKISVKKVTLILSRSEVCNSFFTLKFILSKNNSFVKSPIILKKLPLIFNSSLTQKKVEDNFKKLMGIELFPKPTESIKSNESINYPIEFKVIFLGEEIVALSNEDETEFLLLQDLSAPTIGTDVLEMYINQSLCTKFDKILKAFASEISLLNTFLPTNKQYSNLSFSEFENLEHLISQLNKTLNKD